MGVEPTQPILRGRLIGYLDGTRNGSGGRASGLRAGKGPQIAEDTWGVVVGTK